MACQTAILLSWTEIRE